MTRKNTVLKFGNIVLSKVLPRNRLGDRIFCFVNFYIRNGRLPKNAFRFNDRIHFNKIDSYAMRPEIGLSSCKYLGKTFVNGILNRNASVPTLAVLWSEDEIRKFPFPKRCVVKSTHGSGQVIIRNDGQSLDLDRICSWLSLNYYELRREVNYKNLRPGVIVEPFVFDQESPEDFKIFCIGGKPKIVQIDSGRNFNHKRAFYSIDWKRLPFSLKVPSSEKDHARPGCLDRMLVDAARISTLFDLVRVDFFSDGAQYFVGEITHFHGNGWEQFAPASGEFSFNKILFEDHIEDF